MSTDTKVTAQELSELTNQIVADDKATCCGLLEALSQTYPFPFDRPIVFSIAKSSMDALDWAIRMLYRTPNGSISQKVGPIMFISYCPFCGKKLPSAIDQSENSS